MTQVAQRVSNNYTYQGQLFTYVCVSTLAICESMSRPRVVLTPEEFPCVLKPFVVSETKLHKGNAFEARCSLDSPPRAFTKSRVHTVCCHSGFQATGGPPRGVAGLIEGLGGNHDESAAEPLQESGPMLAKENQLRVCRDIPVEPDVDRHCGGTWLHGGVRLRTTFGLASFAGRDRTSRDVEPALLARRSATNRLTNGTLVRRVRAHSDQHHMRRSSKRQRLQTANETCQLSCGRGSTARANIECP